MAGYSKRTLVEKLGIKSGTIAILNSSDNYEKTLGKLPTNVILKSFQDPDEMLKQVQHDKIAFIQYFSRRQEDLKEQFPTLKKALTKNGMLWISWPKALRRAFTLTSHRNEQGKARITDLNENIIRDIGLENGLVDVKVIAVDENWSGLKFVYRLKDR